MRQVCCWALRPTDFYSLLMANATTATTLDASLDVDGESLSVKMQRSLRRSKIRAFALVAPLLIFILVFFIFPIGDLLLFSIDDKLVNRVLPNVFTEFNKWEDRESLPGEEMYAAMFKDITSAEKRDVGKVSTRMNFDKSGYKSLIKAAQRKFKKIEGPPYKEQMIEANKKWGDLKTWRTIKQHSNRFTSAYFLAALDLRRDRQVHQPK